MLIQEVTCSSTVSIVCDIVLYAALYGTFYEIMTLVDLCL